MDRWRGSGVCCVALYCLRDNEDKKAEGKGRKEVVKEEKKSAVSPESPTRFLLPILLPLFPES